MTKENNIKEMPIWLSLLPLVALVFMLIFTIKTFGSNSLNGATQVVLLSASAICCIIGIVYSKVPWRNFEESITKNSADSRWHDRRHHSTIHKDSERQKIDCCLDGAIGSDAECYNLRPIYQHIAYGKRIPRHI